MNSFNHYAYGSVFDWVFGAAVGIKPTEKAPGYKHIDIAPHPDRRLARHETATTLHDVFSAAYRLLKNGGHFCFCHRPERLSDVMIALHKQGLSPARLQWVHARQDISPFLFFSFGNVAYYENKAR